MKRYRYPLFLIALSTVFLMGCNSNQTVESTEWEPTIYETTNNLDGVTMIVEKETVSSTGLTVILENNLDKKLIYGEEFLLEKKVEGRWYQVPISTGADYGFNEIGYHLNPFGAEEVLVDWDWLYGSLDTGEYRIVKSINDVRKPGDYDKYFLAAEFMVD